MVRDNKMSDEYPAGTGGLRKRIFAWMLEKSGPNIDKELSEYKKSLFADLSGTVLEIGAGTGDNFAYYPAGIKWIGIEPNSYMRGYLAKKAQKKSIDAVDSSIDTVISTHVLCSVNDPKRAIDEIIRVLKPGGNFCFWRI